LVIDIPDPSRRDQLLDLLDPVVYRLDRPKTKSLRHLVAADTIIPDILKLYLGTLDLQVGKMISNLVRKVDDAHVLAVQVEHPVVIVSQVIHRGLGSVAHMNQGAELIPPVDPNLVRSGGPNHQGIHYQVQPDPREKIAYPKQCTEAKDNCVFSLQYFLRR
jgi:hypothetical protein